MTSTIKVDNIQDQDGNNIINESANTITIGASGDTISLAAGASQTGFGRTGTVDWDTTAKTASFTATNGEGYFVNTAGGAVTVTLPGSPSAGNIVSISDYNGTASTNTITIARNSSNINGNASDYDITKANSAVTFVYVDATVGWTSVQTSNTSDNANPFIIASGGTITECGDFKIHTFTGPGTFAVTNAGSPLGSDKVSYLVVAGGGSGGGGNGLGGGGGAGGFREGKSSFDCYTASPLNAPAGLPVIASSYPITVGGGGASVSPQTKGNPGSNSIFSSITSAGGGGAGGGPSSSTLTGLAGGSGGGSGENGGCVGSGAASGNTPPVSPPQGQNGGVGLGSPPGTGAGGGGGAGAVGGNAPPSCGGYGGNGVATSISSSSVTRAGGGGGAGYIQGPGLGGSGGGGNGASSFVPVDATAGTANTGGGGGGGVLTSVPEGNGAAGGSGIVIIRYKFQ